MSNLRIGGDVWSDNGPAQQLSEVWPIRCGLVGENTYLKVGLTRASQAIEEGRAQMGTITARHSGLYPHSRRKRQGFLGVCHGDQHLCRGCVGCSPPVFAKIGAGFTGNPERSHRDCQRFEDLDADHAGQGRVGYTPRRLSPSGSEIRPASQHRLVGCSR
jgi:hypothetical protein